MTTTAPTATIEYDDRFTTTIDGKREVIYVVSVKGDTVNGIRVTQLHDDEIPLYISPSYSPEHLEAFPIQEALAGLITPRIVSPVSKILNGL